jgi:hypothetical protein
LAIINQSKPYRNKKAREAEPREVGIAGAIVTLLYDDEAVK